jgi:aldose 1-epimerase
MRYSARVSLEEKTAVVRLLDAERGVEAAIVPSFGNRVIRMLVHGENILHFPFENPAAAMRERGLNGVPFLAPWANRMAGEGFRAGGREYRFNETAGVLRMDSNGLAIHGMLTTSALWQVAALESHADSAHLTCRLDFWKHPALMANWPFAHAYEMTHRLADGVLEISTVIINRCTERMPVSIGFHPYFRVPGVRRDEVAIEVPVRSHVETDARLVATGEFTPVNFPASAPLREHKFDDGFVDLQRGADGRAVFSASGGGKTINVAFGPKYQAAVVYAPPGQEFFCFEPMTALTNGVNLAADGKYPELQWVEAGGKWRESFWISAQGW